MRADLFNGWAVIAGDFPPSLNTAFDPTGIKPFESPSCYGADSQNEDRLATASCPTGTARTAATKSIGGYTWQWIYNRAWRFSGSTLYWLPPHIDSITLPHGVGRLTLEATIITILPVFGNDLIIITASGSQMLSNASGRDDEMVAGQFVQDFYTTTGTYATVLNQIPYVSNAAGVWSFDGSKVKEWTRPLRGNLGSFTAVAILADYDKELIIGTSKFAVDTETGKLFDYGTNGFLFTSRTMAQSPGFAPFRLDAMALSIERNTTVAGTIKWESKAEDGSWYAESDIVIPTSTLNKTRIEVNIGNPIKAAHKFAIRITSLPTNIFVRDIQLCVQGLAEGAFAE